MKPKTLKVTYWIVTSIFCLVNFASGVAEFFPNEQSLEVMALLGYPVYLFTILGVAKILGSMAVIQTRYRTIKEWAYAGFAFDYLGASASFAFVNGGMAGIFMPFIFMAVLFGSYFLWKKFEHQKMESGR